MNHEIETETHQQAVTHKTELVKSYMWEGKDGATSTLDEQLQPERDYSERSKDWKNSIFPEPRST